MFEANVSLSYSIAVFVIVFLSGCAVNLLKQHFILQLIGIAFFFTFGIVKLYRVLTIAPDSSIREVFFNSLPIMSGLSACLISMVLGFLLFPAVRKMFKS